ncbi:CoA-disulfide reductase [Rhodococcus sp. WS1]|uniref:FAD-dependent oxidoreductase n=1 Tax=unclassified Rhodococcus (in: high G+C Gram-positive bacteria) TaxID=192944 RepID=UPI001144F88E|nr:MULTISPECIES: FAD-dependent oxidoreductase [unclassified Rhodococcus (in: high G+C Gram-positive bacteria)]ROZ53033.1 CoA-disulfide reductase [Rhodococcus sp. WS1]TQC36051.1 CoA-disulfide reductase [Rhodococcus sp. WS7]
MSTTASPKRREQIVVIGADAAGMSAAHQALRSAKAEGRDVDVIALEKTSDTSYSACGIPYLVSGTVGTTDELSARTPEKHRAMGVDLRMNATATRIDLDARTVTYVHNTGGEEVVRFDKLVLATGAHPIIPQWAVAESGELIGGVHPVKSLDHARQWVDLVSRPVPHGAAASAPRAVVVGGGYIGLEMAEAMVQRGFSTTLLTRSALMSSLDSDMSERVRGTVHASGVDVVTNTTVVGLDSVDGRVRAVTGSNGQVYPTDVVVLGLGVRPATELGVAAGLPTGEHGGYLPNDRQEVAEGVWAAGDCCEVIERIRGKYVLAPLGTHANKQGRICGYNVVGGSHEFPGILGTAITRFVSAGTHVEVARTGLGTREATEAGYEVQSLVTVGGTASGYMPERSPIATKIIADRQTRRLLGVQIVGGMQSAKRIDTAAAALWGEMGVDDLAAMDLSYAPPFATVWEAIQLAARRLSDRL